MARYGNGRRSPSTAYEDAHRVALRHTVRVPGTDVALLSRPTKMPGPSWSLPAGPACPFRVNGPNTICGSCYADGVGRYGQDQILFAQFVRFHWAKECMKSSSGEDHFVQTVVFAIREAGDHRFMRVHDSGDFFSETYTRAWIRICAALPGVHFWCPTRSWQAPWVQALVDLAALPNVAVRPSALHFDDPPPVIPGLHGGTTVTENDYTCPAPRQHHQCRMCRRCWLRKDVEVSYQRTHSPRTAPQPLEVAIA